MARVGEKLPGFDWAPPAGMERRTFSPTLGLGRRTAGDGSFELHSLPGEFPPAPEEPAVIIAVRRALRYKGGWSPNVIQGEPKYIRNHFVHHDKTRFWLKESDLKRRDPEGRSMLYGLLSCEKNEFRGQEIELEIKMSDYWSEERYEREDDTLGFYEQDPELQAISSVFRYIETGEAVCPHGRAPGRRIIFFDAATSPQTAPRHRGGVATSPETAPRHRGGAAAAPRSARRRRPRPRRASAVPRRRLGRSASLVRRSSAIP